MIIAIKKNSSLGQTWNSIQENVRIYFTKMTYSYQMIKKRVKKINKILEYPATEKLILG